MKKVLDISPVTPMHWVGDGFPVRSLFSYNQNAQQFSPFLLLDYAGPAQFEPSQTPRGVGEHPHRGFETVTIVYQGEVAHRDSTGQGGVIGPGDVQWMTAGAGILHEEFHSPAFSRSGGELQMVQLWVNLPARHKMTPASYQGISDGQIPRLALAEGVGQIRIIAGEFDGQAGAAKTFSPINVWDLQLYQGKSLTLSQPEGWTLMLLVLQGQVRINETQAGPGQLVRLERQHTDFSLQADTDAQLLLLSGEPINEPVVGYGPFVMNTRQEIAQAMADLQSGRFGHIAD